MAITQTIQWLALPNGITGSDQEETGGAAIGCLSVFVAPRLRADEQHATLQAFSDFLDWAARTQPDQLHFTIEVDNGVTLPTRIVSPPPDPALWQALFTPETPVERYRFTDLADRPLVTFAVKGVLDYLQECYAQVASQAVTDLPLIMPPENGIETGSLTTIFAELVSLHQSSFLEGVTDAADLSRRLADRLQEARAQAVQRRTDPNRAEAAMIQPYAGGNNGRDHFTQLLFFHQRPQSEPVTLPADEAEAAAHFQERVDFHQMLGALGDYPLLLRRLGLIFDLEFALADLPQTADEQNMRKLRVLPVERAGEYSPWTAYWHASLLDQPLFVAVPKQDHNAGIWSLNETDFLLTQLDLDGAALKVLNMASTITAQQQNGQKLDRPIDAPGQAGVPALRTAGISLVRQGHAAKLHQDFYTSLRNNRQIEGEQPVTLFAEDLALGYRLDVWDSATNEWRSLHQRIGRYHPLLAAAGPFELADEGFFQFSVGGAAEGKDRPADEDGELYAHEALVTWDGWSLSAPRPGKSINRNPRAPTPDDPETQPVRPPNKAMTQLQLEITAWPQPGTLPRLRFDHEYRLRIRTVDLAGNGPTLAEATALTERFGTALGAQLPATSSFRYGRFEPVNAPVLLPRRRYSEGESLERLVIRSNVGQSTDDYVLENSQYVSSNERHVAAPKASQQLVETHGLLDAAFDARNQGLPAEQVSQVIAEAYEIARREKGSLNDTTLDSAIEFVRTSSDPTSNEGYTIHGQAQLLLPYLPDPLAEGVLFSGLPGMAGGTSYTLPYPKEPWYDARPFRIRLSEGNEPPAWDEAQRCLTITLPKAGMATIRINSTLPDGHFKGMGVWQWVEAQHNQTPLPNFDEILEAVATNRHWLFTPWREVTLVHAVQQPLETPQFNLISAAGEAIARNWTTTAALFQGEIQFHGPSTAKIDLVAQWQEPRDQPSEGPPQWGDNARAVNATVFSLAIPAPGQPLPPVEPTLLRFEGDDLRYLYFDMVLYRQDWRTMLQQQLAVAATAAARQRLQLIIETLDQFKPHEFNDTKYRQVHYQLVATSRFREYFDQIAINEGRLDITQRGNEVTVKVLSSAPPAAPKVRYVIPTWRWAEEVNGDAVIRRRLGGSLRVYLARPWFSSGEGELLGVVLAGENIGSSISSQSSALYPYTTHIGRDPIHQSAKLPSPGLATFTNSVQTAKWLPLRDLPGNQKVNVVAFMVDFDPDRDLWYGDITLDTRQAYYPFLRLALVRYQPDSIAGAHLSPVVLADQVQTLPDRTLTVTSDPAQPGHYTLTVTGPVYRAIRTQSGVEQAASSELDFCLQQRDPAIVDEELAWAEIAGSRQTIPIELDTTREQGTWSLGVDLSSQPATEQWRLVVEEYEPFETDGAQGVGTEAVRRLVYTDWLEING